MFEIDLLKGTGRPPRSHPLRAIVWTLTFSGLAVLGLLSLTSYISTRESIQAMEGLMAFHDRKLADFQDVQMFLDEIEARKDRLKPKMEEVGKVVSQQIQWSPILEEISLHVPPGIVLADLIAKRNETRNKANESVYDYSLMIGVLTESDPYLVETFLQSLRQSSLTSSLKSIRITTQSQRFIGEHPYLYFAIMCDIYPQT